MSDKTKPRGYVIFTGPFELAFSMSEAETRLEELLDAGHDKPTVMCIELEDDGEPLAMSAHKVINAAKSGEIR